MSLNVRVARRLIAAGGAVALVGFVAVQLMAYRETGGFCLCAPPQLAALVADRAPAHAPTAAVNTKATLVAERADGRIDVATDPLPFAPAAASAPAYGARSAGSADAGHPGPLWGNYPSAARGSSDDRVWFGGGARGGTGGVHWGSGRTPSGTTAHASSAAVKSAAPAARVSAPSRPAPHPSPAPPFGGLFGQHTTTPAPSTAGLPPAVVNGGPSPLLPGGGGGGSLGSVGVPSVSSTPEPASLLLMLTGLAGGFVVSRRRSRRDRDESRTPSSVS